MHDTVADLLTRIRNASSARHRYTDIRWSKAKEAIVKILKDQGFVAHFLVKEEKKKKTMRIFLKYADDRLPVIQGLKRVSKPSLRRYLRAQKIPSVKGGMGISVMSTSQGIMEGSLAREKKLGGEILCQVW
ncbi:MAG: 30S ribosomal protein S8 [Chlamydiae bacterium]|nr:30S ribosomal protein S8 [Chlamydiota bacterium]